MLRLFKRTAPPRDPVQFNISHAGDSFRIALKRVAGATRFTIRVRSATRDVVLTMPVRGSLTAARDFAERHAAWIGARMRRLPKPIPFEPEETIPFAGVPHLVQHAPDARGTVWTGVMPDGRHALHVAGDARHVHRRVMDFLKREARKRLEDAVRRHCAKIDVKARDVTLRDTTSRWGSCSATGGLNFSWRLIMAPPHVLDYLAAHEVAHLIHMNHSDEFWALTRKLSNETDSAEAWLKAHGASLHRYGARGEDDAE
jgi:predicted metal-dependent hydrolase